jgi:hypothetical protein
MLCNTEFCVQYSRQLEIVLYFKSLYGGICNLYPYVIVFFV